MKYTLVTLSFLGYVSATQSSVQNLVDLQGDDGIIDALTPQAGACEPRLWISKDEMDWQMDQFSRKFNKQNYLNSVEIAGKLGVKPPKVHAWELLDKAFSFPRVRRYESVQAGMDMVEHFQDNLNTNISNQVNVDNFIKQARLVVGGFNTKYHDGEFADPALYDPRDDEKKK
jgi:hypothetical protein